MKLRVFFAALALSAGTAQAADPAPAVSLPWPFLTFPNTAAQDVPTTPEDWLTRMTDFTRNASAYKDPRVFVPWSQAVTEPSFYLSAIKGGMEPGGWLNMMNSMAHPDAVKNVMAFGDPNVYVRWAQAGIDPAFYTALLTQFTDPGKMMRWAMMPLDPRVWDILVATVNPNTYIRWGMAAMDPRTWNFMGTVMNPALYTSMLGTVVDPLGSARSSNPWLSWRPNNVMGASSPWGSDPMASFNMFDPALLSNLATFLPTLPGLSRLPGITGAAPGNAGAAANAGTALAGHGREDAARIAADTANAAVAAGQTMPGNGNAVDGNAAASPAPVAAAVATPVPAVAEPSGALSDKNTIVLSVDALFKSGKHGLKDLSKDGKKQLDAVADQLKSYRRIERIQVVGHADRMGQPAANQALSERRARAIKSYLVAKGIKPGVIVTNGVGDSRPVVQCDDALAKAEKVACLAPNRRVEVTVKLR